MHVRVHARVSLSAIVVCDSGKVFGSKFLPNTLYFSSKQDPNQRSKYFRFWIQRSTWAKPAPAYDIGDIAAFSAGILTFFKTHSSTIPAWAHAARIVFAFLPNSAMSERVFALVKCMFGDEQLSTLSDCIQAALMLRDNGRSVG